MWISFNNFASKLTHCQPIDIIVLRKLTKKKVFMATDLNYIKYVVEQIDLPDISFKKMFGEYMVYYKAVPVLLVCDDCVFVKILKETSELSVKIANKRFHMTAQNCITYWILIIPILQGKRLWRYIIAEKTSQRNKNSNVFICPSFRAFLLLFCRVPKRCVYNEIKCCVIVGTCPA